MRWGLLLAGMLIAGAGLFLLLGQDSTVGAQEHLAPVASTTSAQERYTGLLLGVSTPVVGVGVPPVEGVSDPNVVYVDVAEGTQALQLELSHQDPANELDVLIAPPGCELNTGCEAVHTTSQGTLTWSTQDPASGDWTVRLFHAPPGAGATEWTLTVTETTATA